MAKGTIARLMDRGFGFIKTEEGGDLFFHRNELEGMEFNNLNQGQEATLDTWERLTQGVRVLGSHLTTNSGDTFNEGFRNYLSSKHFREFVEYS